MAVSRLTQTSLQNAFQKYNTIWDGKSAVGSMEAISAVTLSATQSTVEFNNIPQTYTHLHLRIFGAGLSAGNIHLNFNGDSTAANYYSHYLEGNGVAAAAGSLAGSSYPWAHCVSSASSSYPTVAIVDITDYTNTNKNKIARSIGGSDINGSAGYSDIMSGGWFSTNAITSILISHTSSYGAYSTFSLYGVK